MQGFLWYSPRMEPEKTPDRTTVIRITIDRPVGDIDREQLGLSCVLSEDEITESYVNPVQRQLLRMVDEMLVAYRR